VVQVPVVIDAVATSIEIRAGEDYAATIASFAAAHALTAADAATLRATVEHRAMEQQAALQARWVIVVASPTQSLTRERGLVAIQRTLDSIPADAVEGVIVVCDGFEADFDRIVVVNSQEFRGHFSNNTGNIQQG